MSTTCSRGAIARAWLAEARMGEGVSATNTMTDTMIETASPLAAGTREIKPSRSAASRLGDRDGRLAHLVGARLRALRRAKQLRLIDLAAASGVDTATISRIERGKTTGTLACHFRLTQALRIPLAELYAGLERQFASARDVSSAPGVAIACPAPAHQKASSVRRRARRRCAADGASWKRTQAAWNSGAINQFCEFRCHKPIL